MSEDINIYFAVSFVLQMLGFVGLTLAWIRAGAELKRGKKLYRTRLLMFTITSVSWTAYIVPTLIAFCYFAPGCFQPQYRDYLRLFSGTILFLYGLFNFLLYYTKDKDI